MSEKHRSYFNEKAPDWDQMMAHRSQQEIEDMIKALDIQPGSSILDAGTGTGVLLPILRKLTGPAGKITALDLAEDMLEQARKKNGDAIQYVQGDLTATSLEQNFFEEIICYSCFPHVIDKAAALCEMKRISKPGGRIVICHTSKRENLNRMHQSLGGPVGHDLLPDNESMIALCRQAGLKDVSISEEENRYLLTARKPL